MNNSMNPSLTKIHLDWLSKAMYQKQQKVNFFCAEWEEQQPHNRLKVGKVISNTEVILYVAMLFYFAENHKLFFRLPLHFSQDMTPFWTLEWLPLIYWP